MQQLGRLESTSIISRYREKDLQKGSVAETEVGSDGDGNSGGDDGNDDVINITDEGGDG